MVQADVKFRQGQKEACAGVQQFDAFLKIAAKGRASDLILKPGQVPLFKLDGELFPLRQGSVLDQSFIEDLLTCICPKVLRPALDARRSLEFIHLAENGSRVRVSAFLGRGRYSLVGRIIYQGVPTLASLGMEKRLQPIFGLRRGLVLVTGATGSGKSTTLAALIDWINRNRTCHILTIEDPIEYVHPDRSSVVHQREIGLDAESFAEALRSSLRQSPDVILVGELRDAETMSIALRASETGHLVLASMHTGDAADSINRIINAVGTDTERITRMQLADHLQAVVSQRLVKRKAGGGRIAAQEIMVMTSTLREKILQGKDSLSLRQGLAQGARNQIQTFDDHLFQLVCSGEVGFKEALDHVSNREDFILRCKGFSAGREAG